MIWSVISNWAVYYPLIAFQFLLSLLFLFFGWRRAYQIWLFRKHRRARGKGHERNPISHFKDAKICIQCPVYNEPEVIAHLLDKVGQIRWPYPNLEVQILDDSTDKTTERIRKWLADNPAAAGHMVHIQRDGREGYKAGMLKYGTKLTSAEYLAVLDADFRPEPDFLEEMMPLFAGEKIAAVQARWDFFNRDISWLTRLQAALLDPHFHIEQTVRCNNGFFFTFNGTAGIWKREAIADAGDWEWDTVTEDLDLSYRAQMKGWKIIYDPDYAVPSELPPTLTAFKAQQMRWSKGTVQVLMKFAGTILRSNLSKRVKLEIWHHLGFGFMPICLAIAIFLNLPTIIIQTIQPNMLLAMTHAFLGGITISLAAIYYLWGHYAQHRSLLKQLKAIAAGPIFMMVTLALCLTTGLSSFQGIFKKGGEFVRTPKGSLAKRASGILQKSAKWEFLTVLGAEFFLGISTYYIAFHYLKLGFGIASAAMALQAFAFLLMGVTTVWERWGSPFQKNSSSAETESLPIAKGETGENPLTPASVLLLLQNSSTPLPKSRRTKRRKLAAVAAPKTSKRPHSSKFDDNRSKDDESAVPVPHIERSKY